MSTTAADRPTQTAPPTQTAGPPPTAGPAGPVPVRRSIFPKGACPAPTAALPAVTLPTAAGADWRGQAQTEELPACPRVSTSTRPTGSRVARHLRAALTGIALAAALLTSLQLYAAAGIADARQAALAEQAARRDASRTEQAEQADAPSPQWTVEGTATEAPSPLGLPRCTTSPDTPLPCLATISPDSTRAVILEEDASLTALVRR